MPPPPRVPHRHCGGPGEAGRGEGAPRFEEGFEVLDLGFKKDLKVYGVGFRVQGLGFRIHL